MAEGTQQDQHAAVRAAAKDLDRAVETWAAGVQSSLEAFLNHFVQAARALVRQSHNDKND